MRNTGATGEFGADRDRALEVSVAFGRSSGSDRVRPRTAGRVPFGDDRSVPTSDCHRVGSGSLDRVVFGSELPIAQQVRDRGAA